MLRLHGVAMLAVACALRAGIICAQDVSSSTAAIAAGDTNTTRTGEPASVIPVPKGLKLHETFLKRAKEGPIDVLFLGDSITQRWATSGTLVWQKHYGDLKPANFGIGGDRTQHILWRIAHGELDGISPRVLVLLIGTNNSNTDEAPDIVAGVTRIVEQIKVKLPKTKLLLLGIFPRAAQRDLPANVPNQRVAAANKELAKFDNGKSIRYLDISKKLAKDGTMPPNVSVDGVHLTEKGYEIWAEAMNPLLQEMLKQ